ncbi:hypothetical protein [Legionella tunisiensis]|uniref:hypothetical protein n=1 Tax=Legionella tunisiensis TaxID=1034944 RepID=UPI0012EA302D|nr:hypothetical protein [Legionella tunisiensis]
MGVLQEKAALDAETYINYVKEAEDKINSLSKLNPQSSNTKIQENKIPRISSYGESLGFYQSKHRISTQPQEYEFEDFKKQVLNSDAFKKMGEQLARLKSDIRKQGSREEQIDKTTKLSLLVQDIQSMENIDDWNKIKSTSINSQEFMDVMYKRQDGVDKPSNTHSTIRKFFEGTYRFEQKYVKNQSIKERLNMMKEENVKSEQEMNLNNDSMNKSM